jgi:hypothetical protein
MSLIPVRAAFQVVGLRSKSINQLSEQWKKKNEERVKDTPQSYSESALSSPEDE